MRRPVSRGAALAASVVLALLWGACAGPTGIDAPDAGRSATYEPGVPAFDLEAVADFRDDGAGLAVYANVRPATLAFVQTDSSFAARYDLALRVRDERGRGTEAFQSFADTLAVASAEVGREADRIREHAWFALAPGRYVVEATLEDGHTGEAAVRRQRVEVPDPAAGGPWLGRPLLYERGDALPTTALHLPADGAARSIRTATRGLPSGATAEAVLYRLAADTSVAYPPFWLSVARGSLAYRGVDDDLAHADTVFVMRVTAEGNPATVTVPLPDLDPGIYRFVLTSHGADGANLARQERALSVKGPGFPRVTTLAELVDALDYIAYPRELDYIRAGATPRERRLRFDAFWGSLVADRRVASNLLRQYYERVEEANLLFTGVKPGWETDRGMIYIVFGAPAYVEPTFEGEVWHYGTTAQDPASTFTFERTAFGPSADPFDHVLLVRQPIYERAWVRVLEQWRRGEVR